MTQDRLARGYFLVQGAAIAAWWASMLVWPSTRGLYVPAELGESTLMTFWLADGAAAAASLAAGWLGSGRLGWFTAGGVVYATLFCVAATLRSGEAPTAVLLMAPAALLSVGAACVLQKR